MNLKGSHVGVVLSFVIFMTFIIFIYVIINPSIRTDNKQYLSEYIEINVKNNVSSPLTIVSLIINKSNPQPCVQLIDVLSQTNLSSKIITRNDLDKVLQTVLSSDGKSAYITKNDSDVFLKIYEAEEFPVVGTGSTGSCQPLSEGGQGYSLGLVRTSNYVFETKIIRLIENYKNNYESIKLDLDIGQNNEFGFGLVLENNTEIKTPIIESMVSIFSDQIPIQYINLEGGIRSGFLNIRVW